VLNALLRFIYLTLPFLCRNLPKTLNKEEKPRKVQKRQNDGLTRLQLAVASKLKQKASFTRIQLPVASNKGEQEAGSPVAITLLGRGGSITLLVVAITSTREAS
jgi:hypothetical protein